MTEFTNIKDDQNYKRTGTGDVFTGKQIKALLDIASREMQAIILLTIEKTDEPATKPETTYGV